MHIPVLRAVLLTVAAGAAAVPAMAQVPGLDNFTLEQTRPPAPSPTPTATPAPSPTATPASSPTASPTTAPSSSATARPSPTPTASPTATPAATPTPTPIATPAASPTGSATGTEIATPTPTPTVAPLPLPAPSASALPPATPLAPADASDWPLWAASLLALAVAAGAGWWWRGRRLDAARDQAEIAVPLAPVPTPEPLPPVVPSTPTPPPVSSSPQPTLPAKASPPAAPGGLITTALKPALDFALAPQAAGIDSLRATLDYVLTLRNTGRAAAQAVALEAWLFSVGADPAGVLEELAAAEAGEPMIAPFALPASGAFDLPAQGTIDRTSLAVLTAGERKLFVPMVGVRALYYDGAGAPQVAVAAFMIGIARAGHERLAPLPLDRGARGFTGLAARRFMG